VGDGHRQIRSSSTGCRFLCYRLFIIQAARQSDPSEARGLGEALQTLFQQPNGPWILGVVAVGLVAYGIYMVIQARYRSLVTEVQHV